MIWTKKLVLLYLGSLDRVKTNKNAVVGSSVAPNKESSWKYLVLFQILVTLVTISDWPWWVSWQHFYSQSLPTKKPQATLSTMLLLRQISCQFLLPIDIKRKYRLLKVCYVVATIAAFFVFFIFLLQPQAVLMRQTRLGNSGIHFDLNYSVINETKWIVS